MSNTAQMTPEAQEMVEDYLRHKGIFTYEEVANHFDVHYMTARDWVQQLITQGIVAEYPLRKGRKTQYQYDPSANPDRIPAALRVVFKGKNIEVSEFFAYTVRDLNWPKVACAALARLYMRSTNLGTDSEQLAGARTPLEIRKDLTRIRNHIKAQLDVVEQLLVMRPLWEESKEFGIRWGKMHDEVDYISGLSAKYTEEIVPQIGKL